MSERFFDLYILGSVDVGKGLCRRNVTTAPWSAFFRGKHSFRTARSPKMKEREILPNRPKNNEISSDHFWVSRQRYRSRTLPCYPICPSLPPGHGVIVELKNDGPYHRGIFGNESIPRKSTGVICPYCGAPVLFYEYPEFGFCMLICRCLAFFARLPGDTLSRADWGQLVSHSARTWIEVEASEKGGYYSGGN
jgi:hypothetical protein